MLQKLGKQSLEFLGRTKISGAGPRDIVRRGVSAHAGGFFLCLHNSLFLCDGAVIMVQVMGVFLMHRTSKNIVTGICVQQFMDIFSHVSGIHTETALSVLWRYKRGRPCSLSSHNFTSACMSVFLCLCVQVMFMYLCT